MVNYFVVEKRVMASNVAAASLSHQQRKRSLNARKNKAPVKTVLCTPYVAKWLVDSCGYAFSLSVELYSLCCVDCN